MNHGELNTETIKERIRDEALRREAALPGEKTAPKIEPLGASHSHPEERGNRDGKMSGSRLRNWVHKSYKIPVAGYFIRMVTAVVNLPVILKNLVEYQAATEARLAGKAEREDVEAVQYDLLGKADRRAVEELLRQVRDHRLHITDQERRTALLLEEMRKRTFEPVSAEGRETMLREEDHVLDAMYMTFEDRFRGTRGDIKRKLTVYLPLIDEMNSGKEAASILDVGCGRGEWLELLREKGHRAKGIDINRVALQQCEEHGLDVAEGDVMEYLRGLKRNSLDVITGFHIIEHLPFKTLIALFDEALAVLKPGGMIVFETPNPANILVSAYDFYRDPSHIKPLHPDTLHFIAESRGFAGRTGSYFVSHEGFHGKLIKSTEWALNDIQDYIRAPRDFALIGYKP